MLLIKNIGQIVTLRGGAVPRRGSSMSELGIIENGAILVRAEHIIWVGPTREVPMRELDPRHETFDGAGLDLVALPGFVDSHTHPIFGGTRAHEYDLRCQGKSYQEIAAAGGGIRASVRQLRAASPDQLVDCAERYFLEFLRHGTTTIEAKSGYGLSLEDELKSLQVLAALRGRSRLETVSTFLGAHDVPDELRDSRSEYVRRIIEEMIPRVARDGLAQFCDVFCDVGYFTVEESRAILQAAKRAGLALRIHAEQLAHSGGARLAAELGALSADHLEWVDDADVEVLQRAGTVATLVPGVTFNLGLTRYPPARKLIEAGVPVVLATDFNPGSCFTLNMQLILSIACSQMKMTPAEVISAATLNAAYALGLSERLGSLEEGKQADIVLMNVPDYREIPYFFGVNHCALTLKRGNIVINRLERT
ncbi:MAG: imidazolonepropionase [Acidobacteriia bacterium]|nr:imidazolonepropionase [Terriglobia bacterium]